MFKGDFMNKFCMVLCMISLFFLTACSGDEKTDTSNSSKDKTDISSLSGEKIDTSSKEAYIASFKKVYDALPEAERAQFLTSFSTIFLQLRHGKFVDDKFVSFSYSYDEALNMYNFSYADPPRFIPWEKRLQSLNGLNGTAVINKGKDVLKNVFEFNLAAVKKDLAGEELRVNKLNAYNAQADKVIIEISNPVKAIVKEVSPFGKKIMRVEELVVAITIKNNSALTLYDITHAIDMHRGEITFVYADGTKLPVHQYRFATLSSFVADDGIEPFSVKKNEDGSLGSGMAPVRVPGQARKPHKDIREEMNNGIKAGQTVSGTVTFSENSLSSVKYPLAQDINATIIRDQLLPILAGYGDLGFQLDELLISYKKNKEMESLIEAELKRMQ